jgi:hypothetical protein
MLLAEAATSPLMRASNVFRGDRGYFQMNRRHLAILGEWTGL